MSTGSILIISSIVFFTGVLGFALIVAGLYAYPAKQKNDLGGKRKIAIIIAATLFFLAITMLGGLGYSLLIGPPSIWMVILIFFVGLISGVYEGVQLYLTQRTNVEAYQLIEGFDKMKKATNTVIDEGTQNR